MAKKEVWTTNEIFKLFRIKKTKTSFYNDEAKGLVPEAKRKARGTTFVRTWSLNQLPLIGEKYGFIKKPDGQKVISVYTPKGGVLKTTFAFNLARILALHNIKVLVIGLDVQGSITSNLMEEQGSVTSIDDIQETKGLYAASLSKETGGCPIEDVVNISSISNLHYIPESPTLNLLEQKIRDMPRREFYLEKLLKPIRQRYDVIIFDNSPSWNFLIQNSLAIATDVISPISCDIETYKALAQNIELINNFKVNMELDWNSFTLIPTKLERTKLSSQIEAQYRRSFSEIITNSSIRSATIGQESSLEQVSVIELDSKAPLAEDYFDVIHDVWGLVNTPLLCAV